MKNSKTSLPQNKNYGVTEVFVKHDYFSNLRVKLLKEVDGKLILLEDKGEKLVEVREVETTQKIYTAKKGFIAIDLDFELKYIYELGEYSIPRYKYIIHQGSSRSSKSWSIEEYCIRKCETTKNFRINIWRDTRQSLGDSVWKDFRKLFPMSGRNYKFPKNTVPIYFPETNSLIEPHGADVTNAHGITQDIAWLNEPYLIPEETFDQIDQRAEQVILDFNPKQGHWLDKLQKHPRSKVIHSTFMLNPFCPPEQKRKILSYDPSNPINVKNKTDNAYMWSVYGLGQKAEKPNKIFTGWKTIPVNDFLALDYKSYYGLDFGLTNPTAICEIKYNDGTFYAHELLYKPEKEMDRGLIYELERIGLDKEVDLICDSASPEKIGELRTAGYRAFGARKGPGSVFARISLVQRASVVYTESSENFEYEYENYEWETDRLGVIDKPKKIDDHILDGFGYGCARIALDYRVSL